MSSLAAASSPWTAKALSVLRIIAALIFLEHGTGKLLGFPALPAIPPMYSLAWIGGIFELIGGALLLVGFFSRSVAFLLAGEMAVAYFSSHMPRNFFPIINGGDAAILYCFVFLYLVFAGPGPWSIDARR
jgi:putative oxidoreductase